MKSNMPESILTKYVMISSFIISLFILIPFYIQVTIPTAKAKVIYKDPYTSQEIKASMPETTIIELNNPIFENKTTYELLDYNPIDANSTVDIPRIKKGSYTGTKSYEYASAITSKGSEAYKLKTMCIPDTQGFLRYDDRYIVAVGTYFNATVGTFIDIELENGTIIPAIVGDIKADIHTDQNNIYSMGTKCATEFIVDKSFKECTGDVSILNPGWDSKVISISVYEYNCLN